MKQTQKIIKYFALAFGILLSINIILWIISGSITMLKIITSYSNINISEKNNNSEIVSYENLDEADELKINLENANLTIKVGEKVKVEVQNNDSTFSCKIENNILKIENDAKWNLYKDNEILEVIIYVPENKEFSNVNIKKGIGINNIKYLIAKEVSLDLGIGDTKINELNTKKLTIKGGVGKISIIKSNFDEFNLGSGVGKVNIEKIEFNEMNINSGIGQIDISLNKQQDEYSIETKSGLRRNIS